MLAFAVPSPANSAKSPSNLVLVRPQSRARAGWKAELPLELRADEDPGGELRPGVIWGWRKSFSMPDVCPACGTKVVQEGKYWRCPNLYGCLPQLVGRTLQLAGRSGFEIDRIGERMVEQLIEHGHLKSPCEKNVVTRSAILTIR